jgi:flagellar hook assembly protein FlgD
LNNILFLWSHRELKRELKLEPEIPLLAFFKPFTLDQPANVSIKVYNVAGQLVEWMAQQWTFGSGKQAIRWSGRDSEGEIVATGLYIVTVTVGNQRQDKVVNVWNH